MTDELKIQVDETIRDDLINLFRRGYTPEQIFRVGVVYLKRGGDDVLLKIYNKLVELDNKMTILMLMFTGLLKLIRSKSMMILDYTYALIGSFPRLQGEEEIEIIQNSARELLNFVNESEALVVKAVKESKKEDLAKIIDELREMVK